MRESRSSGSVGEQEGDDLLYPEVELVANNGLQSTLEFTVSFS